MLDRIIELLDANLERVENLTSLYVPRGRGRTKANDTDVLRGALVLLHASMEDFLRSLLIWKVPSLAKDVIDKYPLLGSGKKNAEKFYLGSLVEHRGKTVDDLIRLSIEENLENYSSFNNIGDIKSALINCGIPNDDVDGNDYENLSNMVARRHNIVHKADRNDVQGGRGNHRTKPISANHLNDYISSVKALRDFVSAHLTPVP